LEPEKSIGVEPAKAALHAFRRLDDIIGIKPKCVIAGRVRKCLVSRRREASDPLVVEQLRPKLEGDLL
jgi:hypothetical protein